MFVFQFPFFVLCGDEYVTTSRKCMINQCQNISQENRKILFGNTMTGFNYLHFRFIFDRPHMVDVILPLKINACWIENWHHFEILCCAFFTLLDFFLLLILRPNFDQNQVRMRCLLFLTLSKMGYLWNF